MRAAFVKLDILQDRGQPPGELTPEAMEVLRPLAESGLVTIVVDPQPRERPAFPPGEEESVTFLRCPHRPGEDCGCWEPEGGLLQEAAARLNLRLSECYLVCDAPTDVALAYALGCRPFLVLGERTIDELYGDQEPPYKDFPMARDLTTALAYILHEEEIARRLGPFPRVPPPLPEERMGPAVPAIRASDLGRWLFVLVLAGLWLSLGMAYILVNIYRVQPLPEIFYYLTLQFIPRLYRGLLFLASGTTLGVFAFRRLAAFMATNASRKGKSP
ncbi:MAG: HAD hydrolase-like protein [Anaerolineae bacterium]